MHDFVTQLPEQVKAAIEVLMASGFQAFSKVKILDARNMETRRRLRTLRGREHYELVLAARRVEDLACAPVSHTMISAAEADADQKPIEAMNVAELRAEAKKHPEITGEYKMPKEDLRAAIAEARRRKALLFKSFKGE